MYQAPSVTEIGTLADLTRASNKIGFAADQFTAATGGAIVGSMTPAH